MPHINRIRVNNIKYNFGTQFYDDFVMRLSGKNTMYDLANGGGKSVLMLLLFQNMIPNCTLDEKQPIEKLFREGVGSTTIHSLIEWRLNDTDVSSNYKYMTTGFCARKAKRESNEESEEGQEKDTASIEYFNYCIFYREFNPNDIKNLPLSKDGERITYSGLKSYLRGLEKKDYSLQVKVFERKGDYQNFIAEYGIYESEWEIIRGINKTEGHVRTYFETNYRTTRKVVEDLFIEEIIQKSFHRKLNKSQNDDTMAQTLLDIKDKLLELSRKKNDIGNFDRQIEVLEAFIERIRSLATAYSQKELLEKQLVQVYHTQKKKAEKLDRRHKELTSQRLAFLKEMEEQQRLYDTAKIQLEAIELKRLEEELTLLVDERLHLEEDTSKREQSLTMQEAWNHYLDYRYYREERDQIKEMIRHLMDDKGDLTKELTMLAGAIYQDFEESGSKIKEELEKLVRTGQEEERELEILKRKERMIDKEIAVLDSHLLSVQEENKEIERGILEIRSTQELLFGTDLKKEQEKRLLESREAAEKIRTVKKEIAGKKSEQEEYRKNLQHLNWKLENLEDKYESKTGFITHGKELLIRADAMKESYGKKTYEELLDAVMEGYETVCERIRKTGEEKEAKQAYLEQLKLGHMAVPSKELLKVKDYMERCHNLNVMTGGEYLSTLDEFSKVVALERAPSLPFMLVAEDGFERFRADEHKGEPDFCDIPVWVIDAQALKAAEDKISSGQLCAVSRIGELFLNPETLQKETEKTEGIIHSLERKYLELFEHKKCVSDDYNFLNEFMSTYYRLEKETWEEYQELKQQISLQNQEKDATLQTIADLERTLAKLSEMEKECQEDWERKEEEEKQLSHALTLLQKADAFQKEQEEGKKKKTELETKQRDLCAHIDAAAQRRAVEAERERNRKLQFEEMQKEWMQVYEPFYTPQIKPVLNGEPEEWKTRFKGMRAALEKEFANVEDKQKLLDNYDTAMSKEMQAIDLLGVSWESLQKDWHQHRIIKTEPDSFRQMKSALSEKKLLLKQALKKEHEKRDKKNRSEGSVSHGKQGITDKYGFYEEISLRDNEIEAFLQEKKGVMAYTQEELAHFDEKLKELETAERSYDWVNKELERMSESGELDLHISDEVLADEENLPEVFKKHLSQYNKLLKMIYGKREDFEKDKQRLADTLERLSAHGLANEMKQNVAVPSDAAHTNQLMDGVKETIDCIVLEKERVGKGIADMQAIKENFEQQCLQTCETIKLELDRLSKLSIIQMEEETISVIGLQIPYVKQEHRKLRMEHYINEMVEQVDGFVSLQEKLKFIRNGLSWKRLFSVIVSDMNSIRLNLYKRERIKEQSRYLRYEEAVGSTGQSQGIYIQFLVGVINYIANINSPKANGCGLRKVIFIDNPFGAAKDVYIWEPIFKLLKTNNVQLVVPARGATPAITGRFDVNYVLGQKLVNGKQQTVVVDYFSSVEQDALEYTALSYEQNALELL